MMVYKEKGLPCSHMLAFYQAESVDPLGVSDKAVRKRAEKSEWEKGMLLKDVCRAKVFRC